MTFARRVFLLAGIWGLLLLVPHYFLEGRLNRESPPAITHPEWYYGFLGVAVAWQIAFLIISRDPVRYRPLMLAAIVEKAGFGFAAIALYLVGRLSLEMLGAGLLDLTLGVLFVLSYIRTPLR